MSYSFKIEQAIRAASILHKDHVRKSRASYPYVTHLFAVAMIISDYTDNEDIIVAGLLHDTLEDTPYTKSELENDFGKNVANIVTFVTEHEYVSGAKPSWKARKRKYIELLKKAPEESLIVAAADKIHNLRSLIEEYCERPHAYLKQFGGTLKERVQNFRDIHSILNNRLTNPIILEFNFVFEEYLKFADYVEKKTHER